MRFAKPRIYTPNRVVEVTTRCLQSRFLLRPSKEVNNEIIAVLARAQRLYGVSVHAFWFGSNHCHLLLSAASQWHISRFMGFTNGNIARRVGRLQRWRERFWCRRYQGIELTDEPQAAYQRLRYVLAQGCKEGLIDSPLDWPGVTSARALADGSMKLSGVWLDRTGLYHERVRRGVIGPRSKQLSRSERREANRKIDITEFETLEELTLEPLPHFADLSAAAYRKMLVSMIEDIEEETGQRLDLEGGRSMGREKILAQDPHAAPRHSKRSPAPACHAHTREQRVAFIVNRWRFVVAYRRAARRLRSGEENVALPRGCFPPRGAFVPHAARAPG